MRNGKKADGKARNGERRDSGLSITEEDKRLVGSKAA